MRNAGPCTMADDDAWAPVPAASMPQRRAVLMRSWAGRSVVGMDPVETRMSVM
ncbi:hypothetical protein GCM10027215_08290 [Nocardioides zeae]